MTYQRLVNSLQVPCTALLLAALTACGATEEEDVSFVTAFPASETTTETLGVHSWQRFATESGGEVTEGLGPDGEVAIIVRVTPDELSLEAWDRGKRISDIVLDADGQRILGTDDDEAFAAQVLVLLSEDFGTLDWSVDAAGGSCETERRLESLLVREMFDACGGSGAASALMSAKAGAGADAICRGAVVSYDEAAEQRRMCQTR